jgi:Tol biopolymer transport system component
MTNRWHYVVALAAFAAAATSCVQRKNSVSESRARARAMLTAARVHNLSFFGEPPAPADPAYSSRTLISAAQHTFTEVGADFDVDVDSSGQRLVFASTRHSLNPDLYWKSVDGVAITQLTSDPSSDIQPAFSRDGAKVAFASNRTGNWDIWVIGTDGGPAVQITRGVADDVHPSWSPDGTQLVYTSLPPNGGPGQLWIADAVAGGTARFIGYGLFPNWSPVDEVIVYQRARERESRWFSIWTVRMVNGEPRYPTELAADVSNAMIQPSFSHDGMRIAFVGTNSMPTSRTFGDLVPSQAYDIWVMNMDGRNRVRLTDGITANYSPTFAPDGRVFFTSNRSGSESIWSLLAPPFESAPANPVADRGGATALAIPGEVPGR